MIGCEFQRAEIMISLPTNFNALKLNLLKELWFVIIPARWNIVMTLLANLKFGQEGHNYISVRWN